MKNNNLNKTPVSDKFLDKLKGEQMKMKPKTYFVLRGLLTALGIFLASLFILYILSFIVFLLRVSGVWYLPHFGFYGIGFFVMSLPWLFIILATILIITLELFVKHFAFAYRRPVLYSILGIVILVSFGCFIVDKTQIHPFLMRHVREGRLPFMEMLYCEDCVIKPDSTWTGTVNELTNDGFVLKTRRSETIIVTITPKTKMLPKINLENGNTVVVLGKNQNGFIEAWGIHKINDKMKLFMQGKLYNGTRAKVNLMK